MADLTDSYCERCGTHYVFNPDPPKGLSLKNARLLAKGFRNFVMTDGQSWNDSVLLARHDDEREGTSRATEAFHRAFNFCMSCRQYACEKCWNARQGACLTCAPEPESGPMAPEGHLIVRTPVTHPDAFVPAPVESPPPFDMQATATYPDLFAPRPPLAETAGSATFPAEPGEPQAAEWPSADLTEMPPIPPSMSPYPADAGESQPADHGTVEATPGRKAPEWLARVVSADGETRKESDSGAAYRSWPIADPLAPEMTLTPEELTLVEAQLSHSEEDLPQEIEPTVEAAPEQVEALEAEADASPAPVEPETVAAAHALPAAAEVTPEVAQAPAAETAPPERPAQLPMVARLFGQFGQHAPAADESSRQPAAAHPSNGLWPFATPWAERPIKAAPIFAVASEAETSSEASELQPEVFEPQLETRPGRLEVLAAAAPETAPGIAEPAPVPAEPVPVAPAFDEIAPAAFQETEPAPAEPVQVMFAVEEPADEEQPHEAPVAEPVVAEVLAPETGTAEPAATEPVATGWAAPEPVAAEVAPAPSPEQLSVAPEVPQIPQIPQIPQERIFAFDPVAGTPAPRPLLPPALTEVPEMAAPPAPEEPRERIAAERQPIFRPQEPAAAAPPVEPPALSPVEQPAAWPPLGASFPAPAPRVTVWPAPVTPPPPPAILSSQSAPAPVVAAMWAQSAQEVLNHGSVRVCHHCGLPVSTHARFCRRCGTSQI
jgi:ribosomal protein L40E